MKYYSYRTGSTTPVFTSHSILEGGVPICILSLPFFPSLMKKIHNETPEKREQGYFARHPWIPARLSLDISQSNIG